MMYKKLLIITLVSIFLPMSNSIYAQTEEEEQILYFQMEPLDDSLFIKIQQEVFIDPPDPKAEIIADLRDANNQTLSIKGTLYPFLAFTPETRARIITYPFKINLEEEINYASVFTRVFEKMRISKFISPPTKYQISPSLQYINPFLQVMGGERFGIPIKQDIGFSLGVGTAYSGIFETNIVEMNFHILGAFGGILNSVDGLTEVKKENNHNNLYTTLAYQIGYVIPFGNFFQVSFVGIIDDPTESQLRKFRLYDTLGYRSKILDDSYLNWEFRYPISILASTRAKFYVAQYLNEWHFGFTGRELSLAGSTFDFRFDIMPHSDVRQPQYVFDVLVQKIAESWGFSAFAVGPSLVISKTNKGDLGVIAIFLNARLKVGTSL